MKRMFLLWPALVVAVLASPAPQAATPSAEVALRVAMETETVKGDLKGAIDQYRKIADASDRAVAVRALVRLAKCYDMLGDAKSAAEARTRLVALDAGAAAQKDVSYRRVATLEGYFPSKGHVSPDGRYWAYDYSPGDDPNFSLFLYDFGKKTTRRITNTSSTEDSGDPVFSPDGKQLVYALQDRQARRYELRTVEVRGAGLAQSQRLFTSETSLWPTDWSADGKWVAVSLSKANRTSQIGVISVQDGSLRVLKSIEGPAPRNMLFTPDSQYLAYELASEIYVIGLGSGREMPAVAERSSSSLIGWSPDGTRLLYASDNGTISLWMRSFTGGAFQGPPELIRGDMGQFRSLGLSRSGSLYAYIRPTSGQTPAIKIASFDFSRGELLAPPAYVKDPLPGRNRFPHWSPDGKSVAYIRQFDYGSSPMASQSKIVIRTLDTGEVREIGNFGRVNQLSQAPDGASFAVNGTAGRQAGLWLVDARTGEMTHVSTNSGLVDWSPDGRRIFYSKTSSMSSPTREMVLLERDLSTGADREVFRPTSIVADGNPICCLSPDQKKVYYRQRLPGTSPPVGYAYIERDLSSGAERQVGRGSYPPIQRSPDGRYLAVSSIMDEATKSMAIVLVPVDGGPPRELIRETGRAFQPLFWAPDSRLIALKTMGDRPEYWWLPVAGNDAPRPIGMGVGERVLSVSVDPAGRRIAFDVMRAGSRQPDEVWVLERFLPPAAKKK